MRTEEYDISNFYLINKISEGGFGNVYKALNINTGSTVVVKQCKINSWRHDNCCTKDCLSIKREIDACIKLNHENIINILGYGIVTGCPSFVVFEYIDGCCLSDMMFGTTSISFDLLKRLLMQLLKAICHIHSVGIIHNDIKPDNVMVDNSGMVKLIDFGSSELLQSNRCGRSIFVSELKQGTPSYIVPDIIRKRGIAEYTDIYAWGVILLECLTRRRSILSNPDTADESAIPDTILRHPVGYILKHALFPNRYGYVTAYELLSMFSDINIDTIYKPICQSNYTFYYAAGNTISYL